MNALADSLWAELISVVDALNWAVEIQRDLAERNADLPDGQKMKFRIGVNLDDVVEEDTWKLEAVRDEQSFAQATD